MNVTNLRAAAIPRDVARFAAGRRGASRQREGLVQVSGLVRSSVGQKWLMAGSGAVLFGWLVLHAAGNLTAFSGARAFDGYAASLRAVWPLLWAARVVLVAAAAIHVVTAVALLRRARTARGAGPAHTRTRAATIASRSMALGGALLLAFIVFHLLHLTFGSAHPDFDAGAPYHNLVRGLAAAPMIALYSGAAALLGLHLFHGLYALPRTLGLLDGAARTRRRPIVGLVAVALALGFAAVPIAVLLGVVR